MEKVLYEYSFDPENMLLCLIPLAVGVVFLANSIVQVRSKKKNRGWDGFVESLFKVLGFIVGPIGIIMFAMSVAGLVFEYKNYKEILKSDDVFVIEGYVENYHPMPYEGHDTEHFEIDGVYFEYSDYTVMNGYNISASHGGVVTHNGQYLKIKYVTEEHDGEDNNIILYISEIGEKTLDGDVTLNEGDFIQVK
jgi:hypothetical protein